MKVAPVQQEKAKNGIVYTPYNLAEYIAQKTVSYFIKDYKARVKKADCKEVALDSVTLIDPACGEGALLETLWSELSNNLYKINYKGTASARMVPIRVYGIDIDKKAINTSKKRLSKFLRVKKNDTLDFITMNTLVPFGKSDISEGYRKVNKKFGIINGFDILIANPPWGADITDYQDKLNKTDFTTLSGQVDSYELFIELALKIVKTGGYFSFIIPDSILNHGKSRLRELLLKNSQIKFMSRMGEKLFHAINRGTVVLICKKEKPSALSKVDCFRLNKAQRKKILENKLTFFEAEKKNKHRIRQSRFLSNKDYLLNIDLKEQESEVLEKIKNTPGTLKDYLTSSRGIELSGTGKICKCPQCELWMPYPKTKSKKCPHCHEKFNLKKSEVKHIVTSKEIRGTVSLINGYDIKRYNCEPSKWLKTGMKGIKYKEPSAYAGKKIVIRKTGVGISASIDYTNSYTTQVVYMLKSKGSAHSKIPIEFILALLNSRVYYFYLTKNFGENEWRSYPYLIQKQILDLPIPETESKKQKEYMVEISKLLVPHLRKNQGVPKEVDARTEFLISNMIGLTKKDYGTIYNAINQSEELAPVKALKNIKTEDIFQQRITQV